MEKSVIDRYDVKEYDDDTRQVNLEDISVAIDDDDRLPSSNEIKNEMDEKLKDIMESYSGSESNSTSIYMLPSEYNSLSIDQNIDYEIDQNIDDGYERKEIQSEVPVGHEAESEE
jgi:hypothetical protein